MAKPDPAPSHVLEFPLPETEHHRLELIREVFAVDMSHAERLYKQAKAISDDGRKVETKARTKLAKACERALLDTRAIEGKLPETCAVEADFERHTVRVFFEDEKAKAAAWDAYQAKQAKPTA